MASTGQQVFECRVGLRVDGVEISTIAMFDGDKGRRSFILAVDCHNSAREQAELLAERLQETGGFHCLTIGHRLCFVPRQPQDDYEKFLRSLAACKNIRFVRIEPWNFN